MNAKLLGMLRLLPLYCRLTDIWGTSAKAHLDLKLRVDNSTQTHCFSSNIGYVLGMLGDPDLQFLLQGGDLLKVRSQSWKKTRYFRLQEDCKTMWHESKKPFRKSPTCKCCHPGSPPECVWEPPQMHLVCSHQDSRTCRPTVYFVVWEQVG